MYKLATYLITLQLFLFIAGSNARAQDSEAWNDDRVGLFVHWGLYSGTEGAWNGSTVGGASEWIQHGANIHTSAYNTQLRPLFAPSTTWATDLALSAKNAGMEYVVVTAKHHDGFTLFNSNEYWSTGATNQPGKTANPYGGSNISPAGRDLMQELVTAVRAQGLKVGFYYSTIDWQHPNAYRGNNNLPKPAVMANGRVDENTAEPDPNAGSYKSYIYNHVEDLLTNYGKIDELWFDYSSDTVQDTDWNAAAMMTMIRAKQPGIMVNNRLFSGLENPNGDFGTPERTIPASGLPFDWETAQAWDNTSWGFKSNANGANYKSTREAVQLYAEASSKGGNMLLNIGPDRFGVIPPEQVTRMAQLGNWMSVNGESIKTTRASGIDASGTWGRMTMNKSGDRYYAIVFDRPANGIIDITSVTQGKIINSVTASRLTATGPVTVPVTNNNGTYTVALSSADLDAIQSATFRIDVDGISINTLPNLASGKMTTSSSVYQDSGLNLHAGLAVDGDKTANTDGSSLNLFHSASNDVNPWFKVDLGTTYRIREITLFNCRNFESRLRGITIQILDASENGIGSYTDLNDNDALGGPSTLKVTLSDAQVVAGHKILITRESDAGGGDDNNVLALSEIEIRGGVMADVTLDGAVDQADLDLLAANWGTGSTWQKGDMNGDGQVDQADLTLALEAWTDAQKPNLASVPAPFLDTDADKLDDNWEMIHFGDLTTQDHTSNNDGDDYNNLWELAFGGDPTVAEASVGVTKLTNVGTSSAEFRYQRPKNYPSTGITYQIETSTNLETWTESNASIGTPPASNIDTRKEWAIFNVPVSGDQKFFRVKITSQTQ